MRYSTSIPNLWQSPNAGSPPLTWDKGAADRVREIQRQVDPAGSVLRQLRTINRRQYQVDGPGALWHIDGNHKLIRFVHSIILSD